MTDCTVGETKEPEVRMMILPCCLTFVLVTGCSASQLRPFGSPGSSVRQIGANEYIVSFTQDEIEALGAPRIHAGADRAPAVWRYLQVHPQLLPPDCKNGIDFLGSGDLEGGKAFARFRCKVEDRSTK